MKIAQSDANNQPETTLMVDASNKSVATDWTCTTAAEECSDANQLQLALGKSRIIP